MSVDKSDAKTPVEKAGHKVDRKDEESESSRQDAGDAGRSDAAAGSSVQELAGIYESKGEYDSGINVCQNEDSNGSNQREPKSKPNLTLATHTVSSKSGKIVKTPQVPKTEPDYTLPTSPRQGMIVGFKKIPRSDIPTLTTTSDTALTPTVSKIMFMGVKEQKQFYHKLILDKKNSAETINEIDPEQNVDDHWQSEEESLSSDVSEADTVIEIDPRQKIDDCQQSEDIINEIDPGQNVDDHLQSEEESSPSDMSEVDITYDCDSDEENYYYQQTEESFTPDLGEEHKSRKPFQYPATDFDKIEYIEDGGEEGTLSGMPKQYTPYQNIYTSYKAANTPRRYRRPYELSKRNETEAPAPHPDEIDECCCLCSCCECCNIS